QSPVFLWNTVLSTYARHGSAHHLFDEMPRRNVVSHNILMSAYSRIPRQAHLAFHLFNQLENAGLAPNGFTLTSLLRASAEIGDIHVGSAVHGQCVKTGFSNNVRVQTSLSGMYSTCSNPTLAMKMFLEVVDRDDLAWNSIISGHLKNGKLSESVSLFHEMVKDGIAPTHFTYSLMLNACAKLENLPTGKVLHAQVITSGTLLDLPLQNSLLDMYCSCCDPHAALKIFSRIHSPDLVSWNSIICGFSENEDVERALNMYLHLRRQPFLKPDEYTLAAILCGTSRFPASHYGEPLHAESTKTGLENSIYVASMLISMYFSNDDSASSMKIFTSVVHKDAILWTDMIAWHVRIGEGEEALKFFHEMMKKGVALDTFTLSSGLSACADLATLKQGEMIHCLAVKTGNEHEVFVRSSMIDMYAKNGEITSAAHVFSKSNLSNSDSMCWNSMITGYGHHGNAKKAIQMYYQMLKRGIQPDHITFLSVLSACSHCGLVKESKLFWNSMNEGGLKQGSNHYSCLISTLSRAGQWEEAEEMILQSPFVDHYMESWRTILSSCIKDENLIVGISAAEHILNSNTEDNAASILLTKLYAAAGRWDDVSEMRRKMRNLMQEKDPGLSSIETRNNIHVFSSGDQSHPQSREICAELRKLLPNLVQAVATGDLS
ncbi:hypothetical protein M569_04691, partial [Genlisea aurea]